MSQLENSAGGWPGPVAVRNYTNYRGCQSGGGLGWAGLGWLGWVVPVPVWTPPTYKH